MRRQTGRDGAPLGERDGKGQRARGVLIAPSERAAIARATRAPRNARRAQLGQQRVSVLEVVAVAVVHVVQIALEARQIKLN